MAIAYQTGAVSSTNTDTNTFAVTLPSGVATGDVVVVEIENSTGGLSSAIPGVPTGWTDIASSVDATGSFPVASRAVYRVCNGSEGSSVTFTWTGLGRVTAVAARFSGVDSGAPVDASASATNTGTVPSVTTTVADTMLVRGVTTDTGTFSTPAGHTAVNTVAATQGASGMVYKAQAATGATGTASYSAGSAHGLAWTVALTPAPTGINGPSPIANPPTLYQPAVVQQIATNAISSGRTLYQPAVLLDSISPNAIANPPTLYAPAVGAAVIATNVITRTPTLYAPGGAGQIIVMPQSTGFGGFEVGQSEVGGSDEVGAEVSLPGAVIARTPVLYPPSVLAVVPFLGGAVDHPWGTSRRWNAWVEFLVQGEVVASSADGTFALVAGTVTEDITRSVTRDATLTLAFAPVTSVLSGDPEPLLTEDGDPLLTEDGQPLYPEQTYPSAATVTQRNPLIPTRIGDLLDANSGTLFRVWAGYAGEEQLMGTFDLVSVPVRAEAEGAVIEVTGQSLERQVQRAGFWQVQAVTAGSALSAVVAALVQEALPSVTVLSEPSTQTVPALSWKPGDNRLAKITDLLTGAGLEGGMDRENRYVMRAAPSLSDFGSRQADWQIVDGVNARIATLTAAQREFNDDLAYNGVVVEGDSLGVDTEPIMVTLWNDNPASPLYFDPYNPAASVVGPRPKYVRSELATTWEDAYAIAQAELAKVLMLADTIDAVVPANAELAPQQYARVASDGLGVDDIYRVARVAHDLAGGPARVSVQRQQVV